MNCWWAPYSDTLRDRPRSSHEHYHTFSSRMLYAVPHGQAAHQLLLSVSKRKKRALRVRVQVSIWKLSVNWFRAIMYRERKRNKVFE